MPVDTGLTPTLTVASAPSSPHRLLADARCALLAAVSLRPSTWSCTAGEVPSHAFLFFPNSADRPWHCHCYVSCCPDELTMTRRFLPLAFNFLFFVSLRSFMFVLVDCRASKDARRVSRPNELNIAEKVHITPNRIPLCKDAFNTFLQ